MKAKKILFLKYITSLVCMVLIGGLLIKSCVYIGTPRGWLSDNYNIKLPHQISQKRIFHYKFRDDQVFYKLEYNKELKKEIIEKYKFKKILDNNINEIEEMVEKFYNMLEEKDRRKFDNNIRKEYLTKYGNYYLIKHRPFNRFVILIFYKNDLYFCYEV